jgi:probable rRNA maturation factor
MNSHTAQSVSPTDNWIELKIDEIFQPRVDIESVLTAVTKTLHHEGVKRAQITIVITGDEEMRKLNLSYRGVDMPTDVLSFASQERTEEDPELRLPPELLEEMKAYLGDVIIAFPYAARQADEYGNSVASELRLLVVHGTLHLLGYDHDSPTRKAQMWAVQDAVLAAFGDEGLSERTYET